MLSFENNVYCLKCNSFNTGLVDAERLPASGSFIDMEGISHGVFLIGVGTLNSATTVSVYQDTSATETASIKALTSASQIIGATDDNKWLTIEFSAEDLDLANDFRYVTIVVANAAGGDDYACIFFLGFKNRESPVTQETNYAYHVNVIG
jgi:hypothetical protein